MCLYRVTVFCKKGYYVKCTEYEKRLYDSSVRDELQDEHAKCVVVSYLMSKALVIMKDNDVSVREALKHADLSDVMDQAQQAIEHLSFVNEDGKIDRDLFT